MNIKSEKEQLRILWLNQITSEDIDLVGGKTASLGEMYKDLTSKGIRIPNAFAITAKAYQDHLQEHNLKEPLQELLNELSVDKPEDVNQKAYWARQLILDCPLPKKLESSIRAAYKQLSLSFNDTATDVAVRSSATAEDLPGASFAGQQETYLNIRGETQLLDACRKCFASLFTERAILYRNKFGFDHMKVSLSICVQKMVRSDLASAGVMFTIDTESGFANSILISASYGLGESVVQGTVNPDEYYVFKPTLQKNFKPILRKELGTKEYKIIYDTNGEKQIKSVPVSVDDREKFVLSDEDILELSHWGALVEDHYTQKNGHPTPMDLEWAKDGNDGKLYIVQARPETVQSGKITKTLTEYHLQEKSTPLIYGHSVGNKIGQGKVRIIKNLSDRYLLQPGEILVTEKTDPDWESVMKNASAIITTSGSRTCHAAIISRELGIPAVVGAIGATTILVTGEEVTVSCAEGEIGNVYEGLLKFTTTNIDLQKLPHTKTKIMLNIADPTKAMSLSFLPVDGVGLARLEFIINNHVKVHPMALINFEKLTNHEAKSKIQSLTKNYADKKSYFVDKLAEGISLIAAAFYPKDVILRFSDFKTNEYSHLLGGSEFEPKEENPMLGFRGASRYYHPNYRQGFALECQAVKKVREQMGLTNLKVMIPFCRTPQEGIKVLEEMKANKLIRGENGLEVYVMCEIPSNVILADQFAEIFDGFSIGSNDLTQLVLGVDRDSAILTSSFNEKDPAVLSMISQVIKNAKRKGRKIGICGQAPSDYPEFAAFLVKEGIDSISLNSDAILKTINLVAFEEQKQNDLNVLRT